MFNDNNIEISDNQIGQFIMYYELLIEWNNKFNLTSIVEFKDVIIKHFLDSASLIKFIDFNNISNLIDIGTGGGFPGIPLKIMNPNLDVVLVDSLNKRINFLKEVISQLGLTNCEAIHSRAEDLAANMEYREQFDLSVSRAVSNLSTLSEYCLPFVKPQGYFVSYKSSDIDEELQNSKNAIKILKSKCQRVEKFNIVNTDINRSFVIIKKLDIISKKYPRSNNLPKKNPL